MGHRGCIALLVLYLFTSLYSQCKVLARQGDFYEVDEKEDSVSELTPIYADEVPEDFCIEPESPSNGEIVYCGRRKSKRTEYLCVGRCEIGFEFPNKEKQGKLVCDLTTGNWKPKRYFPGCQKKITCDPPCGNGGTCIAENDCSCTEEFTGKACEQRLCTPPCQNGGTCLEKNTCSCAPLFEGDRCQTERCKDPPKPYNGAMKCSRIVKDAFKYRCSVKCENGYHFPDRKTQKVHNCDSRTKEWTPKYEFPDCEADCNPPCQNGGRCEKGNKCICLSNFDGDKCENAACTPSCKNGGTCEKGNKCICEPGSEGDSCENVVSPRQGCVDGWTDYLNTDSPKFSHIGDDESLDRIREHHPVCTGGTIKDIECKAIVKGRFVDYRQMNNTLGLKCSKDTGFTCTGEIRGACEDFAVRFLCECGTSTTTSVVTGKPEPTASPPSRTCPEVPPQLSKHCSESCPPDFACVESACVPRDYCPCFRNDSVKPSRSIWISADCEICECKSGGNSVCGPIKCLGCSQGERPVMDSNCLCKCAKCPEGTVFCRETGVCVEKRLVCNGAVKCSGIQITCQTETPVTELPATEKKTLNCSTDHQPGTNTCEILGDMFQTFDGYTYQYEACSHVLMKEKDSEAFAVTVHKICSPERPVMCYRHLIINVDGLVVTFGPGVDTVTVKNTRVPVDSLWLVSRKFSDLELKASGSGLVFRSLKYNFDVTWDKLQHSRIKVSKCLTNRIVGLCGLYDETLEGELNMPNDVVVPTHQEFGDSWATGSLEKCSQPKYTYEITKKANETCINLRQEPLNYCYKRNDLNRKVQACVTFMLECMQRAVKAGTNTLDDSEHEKCKCYAYESFVADCEIYKNRAVREWRILYGCAPTCPPGMEWQDCGPGCQLTCDNYRHRSGICTSTCVPGCYCPLGLVRHKNQCVQPKMCQDCVCRGHGDPNYITFDGRYYAFQGNCTYILAQHWASEDATKNFRILGTNVECPEEPKASCIHSIQIFWNGHIIKKQKSHLVYLDRKPLRPDESPFEKRGISITYVESKHTLIHIKQINLVVRFFDHSHGFTIELPSFYYYNKTEGLCGVCNFIESDDLYHRDGYVTNNIEDFAYSWLAGQNTREECVLERTDVVQHPPGLCNFTVSPCEAILDPSPFVRSCQNDIRYSRRPENSMCRSKLQYAQQCCERGVPLDEWLDLSGCGVSCPAGMVHKCTSACPKTCENYKTYKEDECLVMPQSSCVCPEGNVLKLGKCVKTTACEVCDAKGHVIGDVWQDDPCKTCECLPDLSTKCTVQQCPGPPACKVQERLLKLEKDIDTCCDAYKCEPKSESKRCEEPKLEACPPGKALVVRQTSGVSCPVYQCECFPQLCPPVMTPFLEDGESFHLKKINCCPQVQIRCNPNLCAPQRKCNQGFKLSTERGRCCLRHACVPQENVCFYQHQYDVLNGTQVKLPLERYYDKEYQPGSSWHDGLCRKCTCSEVKGRPVSRCAIETCRTPRDFPDSEKYIREEIHVPGACCPNYRRKLCVDQGVHYKIGDEWSLPEGNSCTKISRCLLDNTGEAVIDVASKCEKTCLK